MNRDRRGITLVEMLIAVILMSAAAYAIWSVYFAGMTAYNSRSSREDAIREASGVLYRLSSELRCTRNIVSAGEHSITFTADADNDGEEEEITYNWQDAESGPLEITISGSGTVNAIQSLERADFTFFDANGVQLSDPYTPSLIRLIRLRTVVLSRGGSIDLVVSARLRNL